MDKKALLEAAMFVSDKPLSMDKISAILGIVNEEAKEVLEELRQDLQKNDRGYELSEGPEGFELRVKLEYRERVVKLAPLSDLSDGMMRTLALISAKQPVKQSLIVRYQGNKVYDYVATLEERGLIKTEKYQRTKLITTTPNFERYFGKSAEELKQMLSKKIEETKQEVKQ
ncbi:MAG TPA: SMC-Scp complex subunit ScpB [archaeon]|nr:SMC-Scp complex subunit ScpB [archaeon]